MVRAATWLHFGSGGAARARRSTTVTSMPRQARSIASVRPTGPAPAMSTRVDVCWPGMVRSLNWHHIALGFDRLHAVDRSGDLSHVYPRFGVADARLPIL